MQELLVARAQVFAQNFAYAKRNLAAVEAMIAAAELELIQAFAQAHVLLHGTDRVLRARLVLERRVALVRHNRARQQRSVQIGDAYGVLLDETLNQVGAVLARVEEKGADVDVAVLVADAQVALVDHRVVEVEDVLIAQLLQQVRVVVVVVRLRLRLAVTRPVETKFDVLAMEAY